MQVAFTGFKSVVAGQSQRQDNNIMSIAMRLTGKDLKDFQDILREYPLKGETNQDVLCISIAGEYDHNNPDLYFLYLNGKEAPYLDKGGQTARKAFRLHKNLMDLLSKINWTKHLDVPPKGSTEEETMKKILAEGFQLNPDEYGDEKRCAGNIFAALWDKNYPDYSGHKMNY